mgnify:CR=1 FL=1
MTASEQAAGQTQRWVLQFCHGYDGPFLDCARQYAVLFKGTPYKVCTVYLTGAPSAEVERGSASDEVIFLDYSSAQVRGLKLAAIRDFRRIAASRDFALCIGHRFKPIYIALLGSDLPVIGVHHAFGDYKRRSRQLFANFFRKRLALLGVSNAVRDDIRACLPDWPAERIETLYNRIDVEAVQAEQVSREAAREHLGLPLDAWVVGNVGRLHPDKDQTTLIRGFAQALPQLPDGSLLAKRPTLFRLKLSAASTVTVSPSSEPSTGVTAAPSGITNAGSTGTATAPSATAPIASGAISNTAG